MAAFEGASRIKRAGKWIASFGIIVAIIGVAVIVGTTRWVPYEILGFRPLMFALVIYFGYFPAFIGGTMWVAGWIVEGFAQRSPGSVEK